MIVWLLPLIRVWQRYDKMPFANTLFICIMLWPTLLFEDLIVALNLQELSFFLGVFEFVPALIMTLVYFALQQVTQEKKSSQYILDLIPVLLIAVGQIPYMLMPFEAKLTLLNDAPQGDFVSYAPVYFLYFTSGFIILFMALRSVDLLEFFHRNLSEQVVDVNYYKMDAVKISFNFIVVFALGAILLTALVAFSLVQLVLWQSVIHVLQAILLLVLIVLLSEKRRYSPSPFDAKKSAKNKYSDAFLLDTLTKAENAIIRSKAYKKIGLRIRQLADTADIDPQVLAIATRKFSNRNFRAFIYHYRLEYAKKVLMRTDAKVATVARRLGFESEQFLSDVFVKYVEMMARENEDYDYGEDLI
jgi:AraC-like DNA-binding protein